MSRRTCSSLATPMLSRPRVWSNTRAPSTHVNTKVKIGDRLQLLGPSGRDEQHRHPSGIDRHLRSRPLPAPCARREPHAGGRPAFSSSDAYASTHSLPHLTCGTIDTEMVFERVLLTPPFASTDTTHNLIPASAPPSRDISTENSNLTSLNRNRHRSPSPRTRASCTSLHTRSIASANPIGFSCVIAVDPLPCLNPYGCLVRTRRPDLGFSARGFGPTNRHY